MKKNKRKEKARPLRTAVILVSVVLGAALLFQPHRNSGLITHSHDELQARYDYILSHVTQTNICPLLRAVHFSIGKNFAACGTMVLNRDGTQAYIVTANHLFSETQPGSDYYDYHVISEGRFVTNGHLSRVVLDSIRTSPSVEGIQDIALCYPGDANLISRTSKVIVSAATPMAHAFAANKIEPFQVTSITTAEHFRIVGEVVNAETNAFYVMLYESVNGESGSGFWDGTNKLFVISGDITISPQMRHDLDIPAQYQYLTICSAVSINW